jgi:hypothetical protein
LVSFENSKIGSTENKVFICVRKDRREEGGRMRGREEILCLMLASGAKAH